MSNHAMDPLVGLGGTEMNKIPFCLQVALFLVRNRDTLRDHVEKVCQ